MKTSLPLTDPAIAAIIEEEAQRQQLELNLIASENYASKAVREATASVLTNKYAEGYPGKRYYGGCEVVDKAEILAIERCKQLFGADAANVQPHAGSQANMAVYSALIKPGDTIMGMSLAMGGHLTHGHNVNFSGSWYHSVPYGVDQATELIDYQALASKAEQHKPKLLIIGASSYARTIDFAQCAAIAQSVGALLLVDMAHIAGLIAAGLHPSPVPYADCVSSTTHKTLRGPRGGFILSKKQHADAVDRAIMPGLQGGPFMHSIAAKAVGFLEALQPEFKQYQQQIITNAQAMAAAFTDLGYRIVTGGTDTHLFIIDLRGKNLTGLAAEKALGKAGISVSRSCIPYDPEKPWVTSGIRIGTPAITTRGMQKKEAVAIAHFIDEALQVHADDAALARIKTAVQGLCKQFLLEQ